MMQKNLDFEKRKSVSVAATAMNEVGGKLVEMFDVTVLDENEAPQVNVSLSYDYMISHRVYVYIH